MKKTETIYNKNADFWSRNKPLSLSDFTARDYLFKYLGKLNNLKIADIGCGEGYCSREFIKFGAKHIIGVDASKSMIQNANKNVFKSQNETFVHADLKRNIPKEIFKCDIICAIFLFNYIDNNNMQKIFNQIALKKKKIPDLFLLYHTQYSLLFIKKNSLFHLQITQKIILIVPTNVLMEKFIELMILFYQLKCTIEHLKKFSKLLEVLDLIE